MKKFLLFFILITIAGCGDLSSNSSSNHIDNKLDCEITMFNIELDEQNTSSVYTIKNAVRCNGSSNVNVSFSGDNAKYFLVNDKSELSYNLNNGVNHGDSLDLTFSISPEADNIQGKISANIILKVANYSTMEKSNFEYTITRLK